MKNLVATKTHDIAVFRHIVTENLICILSSQVSSFTTIFLKFARLFSIYICFHPFLPGVLVLFFSLPEPKAPGELIV